MGPLLSLGMAGRDFYLTWEKTNFTPFTVLCIRGSVGHRRGSCKG